MTRSQIEYILTLSKLKNFGKAAEACFITQSTLSTMVAKFEAQNGVEIFNRSTRPLSVTPQGEEVLQSLKNVYREYQLLDNKLDELKDIGLKELSIACIPTVAPYLYPLVLNKISEQYDSIDFTIHELTTEIIVGEIIAGDIDVGIVSVPLENKELLEYPIYEEDFLIYDCGAKQKSKKYRVSDIDLDRLWLLEEGHCLRNQVGKICNLRQHKKIGGNLTYNCGSIFSLVEMVSMNKGVTLLPRLALASNYQIDKNKLFEISKKAPSRKIGLIAHRSFAKKSILKELSGLIFKTVNSHLPKKKSSLSAVNPY